MKRLLQPLLPIVIGCLMLSGCFKKVDCDNAQTCVINNSGDTIFYCWGCNFYNDTLLPGGSACTYVGEIQVRMQWSSTKVVQWESDHGNYAWTVDDCYIEKVIE